MENKQFVLLLILLMAFVSNAHAQNGHRCVDDLNPRASKSVETKSSSSSAYLTLSQESIGYTSGYRSSQKILRLTAEQYKVAAQHDQIDPQSILILDRIPLDVDMPVVAGIVMGTPLAMQGTHIQVQAHKMGTPLLYVPGAFTKPELQDTRLQGKFLSLKSEKGKAEIEITEQRPPGTQSTMPPSALPVKTDRTNKSLVPALIANQYPLAVVGSKFKPLADLQTRYNVHIVPEIYSMTSGFYEAFVDSVHVGGSKQTLRSYIRSQLSDVAPGNEAELKKRLENIRNEILNASIDTPFFDELSSLLKSTFGKDIALSIRSNNENEDLLSAGVFESSVARNLSPQEVRRAVLKCWSSLFTYRSYSIRRFYNLREENLSMPLLVHPFIHDEQASGTGSFKLENGHLVFDAQIAHGHGEKATNPTEKARVTQVRAEYNGPGQVTVKVVSGELEGKQSFEIRRLVSDLAEAVQNSFKKSVYTPNEVEVEFLLRGNPTVLQFKPRPAREVALAVLSGKLKLEDLEREKFSPVDDGNIEIKLMGALRDYHVHYLRDVNFDQQPSAGLRYGVIQVGSEFRMIVWDDVTHERIRMVLQEVHPKISMVFAGYLSNLGGLLMMIPENHPVDGARVPGYGKKMVELSLKTELKKNPGLTSLFQQVHVQAYNSQSFTTIDLHSLPH